VLNNYRGCHGQGKVREKQKFFKVREKSGNFAKSQGKSQFLSKSGKSQGILPCSQNPEKNVKKLKTKRRITMVSRRN